MDFRKIYHRPSFGGNGNYFGGVRWCGGQFAGVGSSIGHHQRMGKMVTIETTHIGGHDTTSLNGSPYHNCTSTATAVLAAAAATSQQQQYIYHYRLSSISSYPRYVPFIYIHYYLRVLKMHLRTYIGTSMYTYFTITTQPIMDVEFSCSRICAGHYSCLNIIKLIKLHTSLLALSFTTIQSSPCVDLTE